MSDRELVLDLLKELPEDVTMPEILRQLEFLRGVKEAIAESDRGEGITLAEARERIKAWSLKSS